MCRCLLKAPHPPIRGTFSPREKEALCLPLSGCGERAGVRGRTNARSMPLPLTLTLSP